MSLKRLLIENVGPIAQAEIELAPFTVLVGPSRAGKSSILRGLRALLTNQTGSKLIRHGADRASVTVETDDGHRVQWIKTSGTAKYSIDGREYTKLAGAVPAEVYDAIGIRPVKVDSQELWPQWSAQGEYAFLIPGIGATGGQVARALSSLTRLQTVVIAQHLARKHIRSRQQQAKLLQAQQDKLEERLSSFAEFEALRDEAERLLERARTLMDQEERVRMIPTLVNRVRSEIPSLPSVSGLRDRLTVLLAAQTYRQAEREQASLQASAERLITEREQLLTKLQEIERCPLCGGVWSHENACARPE